MFYCKSVKAEKANSKVHVENLSFTLETYEKTLQNDF